MEAGVRSEYLKSVFPAESFPAWQTIQTGLFCGEKKTLLMFPLHRPLPRDPWNCWQPVLRQRGDFFFCIWFLFLDSNLFFIQYLQVHEMMRLRKQSSFYAFFNIEDERTTDNQKWWQKVSNWFLKISKSSLREKKKQYILSHSTILVLYNFSFLTGVQRTVARGWCPMVSRLPITDIIGSNSLSFEPSELFSSTRLQEGGDLWKWSEKKEKSR